jgi:hypothetical protein
MIFLDSGALVMIFVILRSFMSCSYTKLVDAADGLLLTDALVIMLILYYGVLYVICVIG